MITALNALQVQCLSGWAGIGAGLIVAPTLYRLTHGRSHKR